MTTPTPSSRAYGRVLASLLAFAAVLPASAGVTGWREVRGTFNKTVHTFFYPLEERGKPVVTNEGGHATIRLYKKTVVSSAEKARSHLFSKDGGKTYRLHLIAEDGPERDLSKGLPFDSKDVAAQPTPAAPPADAAPAGVDADVWAEVNAKYGAGLSAEDKVLLGKVLTHVKKNNPDKYAGVQAWLQKDPKAHAAKVAQAARARGVPAAAAELLEWASATPSGAGPAPGAPAGGATGPSQGAEVSPVGAGRQVGTDGGPQQRLQTEMKQEARWQDVAARIIAWSWPEGAGGASFIRPDARKDPSRQKAYEVAMREAIQEKTNWGDAINVYYVLGPGEPVPDWVTGDPALKELLVDAQIRIKKENLVEVLEQCLNKWRHGAAGSRPEKCDKTPDANQVRVPYPGGTNQLPKWPHHFLKDAGNEARIILQSLTVGATRTAETINNAPGSVPDATGGSGQRQTRLPSSPSSEFGIEHLFGKWGDPNVFHLDGRNLAMTLRTQQSFEGDPPRSVLKHYIGLYDISNPSELYGRRIDIAASGEQEIDLKPGGKKYKISFSPEGGDTKIVIQRPDGKLPKTGTGSSELPSLNRMYQLRAQQALDSGNRVFIAGKHYRVTGESSSAGSLLFWDEAELEKDRSAITERLAGQKSRTWVPSMMADVVTLKDGRPQPLADKVALGKEVDGKWQGLRWDSGIWVPAEGPEYKPKVPAAPGTGTPATPPPAGGQPTPGTPTTPGTPGGPAPTPAAAEATVAKLNSELGPEAAKRVVFFVPDGLSFGRHLGVGRRGEDGKPIQGKMSLVFFPGLADGGTNLREAIHKGRYLVTSTDKGFQVDDMLKYDFVDGKIYGTVGVTLAKDKVVRDVTDKEALALVLRAAGFEASETQIMANLEKAIGNVTQWTVVGFDSRHEKPHLNVMLGTSKCVRIHPKYDPSGCTGDESVTATVPGVGQGMALDPVGGATQAGDTGFLDSTEIGTFKVTRVEPKAARAGLYLAVDGEKKNWYLTFLIKPKEGGDYKRTHVAFRNAKSEAVGVQVEAPPSGLNIGGVTLKGALVETAMKASASEDGDLSKAGFIGAYTGSNGTCVGVVAWWGLDLKTACDRCGAKMAGNACVEK